MQNLMDGVLRTIKLLSLEKLNKGDMPGCGVMNVQRNVGCLWYRKVYVCVQDCDCVCFKDLLSLCLSLKQRGVAKIEKSIYSSRES